MSLNEIANDVINFKATQIKIDNWDKQITLNIYWSKEEGFTVDGEIEAYVETIPATRLYPSEDVWKYFDIPQIKSYKISVLKQLAQTYGFEIKNYRVS